MKDNYTRYELENSGFKIILEMPQRKEEDVEIRKELRNILSSTLKEQLKQIA